MIPALVRRTRGFAPTASVLLETEWVLRSKCGWPRKAIADALADIIDLPTLADARRAAAWAIARYAAGADYATFDRRLALAAGTNLSVTIETLG